uniref:ADAM metallopeptidase domain 23 n=1 Tax=Salmo trutta TaxID=8032 RepID=A0A674DAG7_SALTR
MWGLCRVPTDCHMLVWWWGISSSALSQGGENEVVERDAEPLLLEREETAAAATDNTSHRAAEHVITYPSRLIYYLKEDSESTYHDLDTRTRNQAVHLAQASFQLEAFGSRFVLDLTLNNDLLSSDYVEIHYEEGKPVLSKGGEHCYYHGQVRGKDDSHVEQQHVKPLDMLKDFSKYRAQSIKQHADAVHLFSNVTFHYRRSSVAYFGGMCSVSRGVGVNEYGTTWTMASSLSQSLAQNLGIQWDPAAKRKECGCSDSWLGCIMEDTGVQHPRKFSKCSISDYKEFLLKGGGSCLYNKPTKLFESTECGNGYIEVGEECDCGDRTECYKECCKKCSLANGAHCIGTGNPSLLFSLSLYSGQCPPNLHKQDGYQCQVDQGRCYSGECKTRGNQCKYLWGPKAGGSEKFCYEKLNTEGTEKGNCGKDGDKWLQCSKHDVFCGFLLCSNIGHNPRIGMMKGDITRTSFNHQGRPVNCSGGHVLLDDETDLGYVEDGTPCGPSMMCLDHKCLPIQSLNMSTCPSGPNSQVCSSHGVCNNEATCTCDTTWAGTDCSMPDPPKVPAPTEDEEPKGPSATNLIIGSIAGAILVAAIVLGGTGWGFNHLASVHDTFTCLKGPQSVI